MRGEIERCCNGPLGGLVRNEAIGKLKSFRVRRIDRNTQLQLLDPIAVMYRLMIPSRLEVNETISKCEQEPSLFPLPSTCVRDSAEEKQYLTTFLHGVAGSVVLEFFQEYF